MYSTKRILWLGAAVTLVNIAYLSTPAQANPVLAPCSGEQLAYAQGFADSDCGGPGAGTVTECESYPYEVLPRFSWYC